MPNLKKNTTKKKKIACLKISFACLKKSFACRNYAKTNLQICPFYCFVLIVFTLSKAAFFHIISIFRSFNKNNEPFYELKL
jgi:hypothetical protein